jgi:menaquinone-dependent protoporphyrinogen oxidase
VRRRESLAASRNPASGVQEHRYQRGGIAMKLLIAYATTDGMTARIAERIAEAVRGTGHAADVVDTAAPQRGIDPGKYDGVLVGASMHVQGYQRAATRFVRRHLDALRSRPSAFFSVCLSILSKDPKERAESRRIADQFPARLGWKPDVVEIIPGALMFSRYGFFRRTAMKIIAKKEMGSVDASRDTVYTNWAAVDRFAKAFVARVAARDADSVLAGATV